jgi:DNA-binding response OmpR family regulator
MTIVNRLAVHMVGQMTDFPHKTRVLVVEDEALVAWLLRDVLEHHGYEVVGPASTQEGARELVQRERPEVAVVDVKLKQGDGIETAREMVREGVGVLFLTGHGSRLVAESGLRSGVVEKPFRPDCIVRAVEAITHLTATGEIPRWAPRELTILPGA